MGSTTFKQHPSAIEARYSIRSLIIGGTTNIFSTSNVQESQESESVVLSASLIKEAFAGTSKPVNPPDIGRCIFSTLSGLEGLEYISGYVAHRLKQHAIL